MTPYPYLIATVCLTETTTYIRAVAVSDTEMRIEKKLKEPDAMGREAWVPFDRPSELERILFQVLWDWKKNHPKDFT